MYLKADILFYGFHVVCGIHYDTVNTAIHKTPFQWSIIKQESYDYLKKILTKVLVVLPPDWSKSFHMFVHSSDIAIGSALMQLSEPNWYRPVYYDSRKLSTVERNYSTTEQEALGMIYSVNKFRHYLLGRTFTFHVVVKKTVPKRNRCIKRGNRPFTRARPSMYIGGN